MLNKQKKSCISIVAGQGENAKLQDKKLSIKKWAVVL